MIPVSPRSKSMRVSACWRKLTRRMLFSRTGASEVLGRAGGVGPRARVRRHRDRGAIHRARGALREADRLGLGEVADPEEHECRAIDVAREDARLELRADG